MDTLVLFDELKKVGVDIDDAMSRFMNNQALYIKFLKKFLEDKKLEDVSSEMLKKNDYRNLIEPIHTLKGLTGNMGFKTAYSLTSKIVYNLRNDSEIDKISEIHSELLSNLSEIRGIIEKYS